jgi:uncharacterized protein YecT (DUF1311 family)
MQRFLLFYIAALFLFLPNVAMAQRHAGYCDKATTTADALDCVNQHKLDVQQRLNTVYEEASEVQTKELQDLLSKAQQSWVAYRDAQCLWEAGLAANPSLERIYELSCMTLLTNLRTDLLKTTLETQKEEEPREFGSNPRWMNVLIQDYPSVFWRFGKWKQIDLDCDGNDEQIVSGVEFIDEDKKEGASASIKKQNLVVAISDNPLTGKPDIKKFDISVNDENENIFVCDTEIEFEAIEITAELLSEEQEGKEEKICPAVRILDNKCTPLLIYLNNNEYEIKKAEIEDN